MDILGKKVLVLGMKTSGVPACYLLREKKAFVTYYDDNISPLDGEFLNVTHLSLDEIFENLSLIVTSPGFASSHKILTEAIKRNVKVISELELGYRYLNAKVIGVTGTNGKTTTVNMLHKILSSMGLCVVKAGNIGYPLSQVALDGDDKLDYAIVEASGFQLEHINTFRCHIAILMNVAADHMDRYDTFMDYTEAKKRIFLNQTNLDFALINQDDLYSRLIAPDISSKVIYYGVKKPIGLVSIKDKYYILDEKEICHVKESRAKGEHNKYNLLAAMNAAVILGAKREHCLNLIRDYVPLAHRIEYVTTINGKTFYNDSKGTNIHATRFAVESVDGTIGLIMGGSDKREDYCDFFDSIDPRIKYIAVTGSNADKILNSAMKMGYGNISVMPDLAGCLKMLYALDVETILFSPSAASFDRYADYVERGDTFKRLVYEIKS